MISYAFVSLAHVRILLLPVGQIPRATFDTYAAEIRSFESIRLGDIPGDAKDERGALNRESMSHTLMNVNPARFMPSPLSSGHLHLSFPSHPSLHAHSPLSLFRPSHFNLGIIGIAACSSSHPLSTALEQFENTLAEISPETLTFPLAKTCFAFQDDEEPNVGLRENPSGLAIIPNAMGNKKLYIGTLLADLCSQILGEFGRLVCDVELVPRLRLTLLGSRIGNSVRERVSECHSLPNSACGCGNAVCSRLQLTPLSGILARAFQSAGAHRIASIRPSEQWDDA